MTSQSSFQAKINVDIKIDAQFEMGAILVLIENALRSSRNLLGGISRYKDYLLWVGLISHIS